MTLLLIDHVVRIPVRAVARVIPRVLGACVCTLLVVFAPSNSHAQPQSQSQESVRCSPADALPTGAHSSDIVEFRLGTAAQPFGWSTVIGDFNIDGKPDVAVADHVGQWATGYEYRVDVSMSGQGRDDFTFESPDDAVTITASDVDHDRDLDILVERPITGEPIAVWLNDGHGHFSGGDIRRFPASVHAHGGIRNGGVSTIPLELFDVSGQRRHCGLSTCVRFVTAISRFSLLLASADTQRTSSRFLRTTPRAPPSCSDLLS